jgi:serine/threonine protein kinase
VARGLALAKACRRINPALQYPERFAHMENTLIDGRYLLLSAIGAGGEARVFRARDQSTNTDVAVRVTLQPRPQTAHPAPSAQHPAWVQLLGLGTDPEHGAYNVFELLEGKTLAQVIRTGPLPFNDWRAFMDQSFAAVEALHADGWVHGDLNADNFFQTGRGWKLLELPFLRLDPPAGRSAVFGSIHTLAPEQIDGAPPGIQTDIYALGCLYYYAASGTWPHPGGTSVEVAIHCLRFPPEPLAEKAPALPPAFSAWVMKLLTSDPAERTPTLAAARQLLRVA